MKAAFTVQMNDYGRFVPALNVTHRADPSVLHIAGESENCYRDFAVSGFGGENEISLFATGMQDGSTDVLMLHASCDNPLSTFHHRFYRADRAPAGGKVVTNMVAEINQQIAEWWPA
jgi:hypothetical protein